MKIKSILAFAAVMALSFAAHAHDCSGGAGGGMDATGNQCNDESAYTLVSAPTPPTPSPVAHFELRHEPNAIAAGAIKPVATNTAGASPARSASQRAPKKHSQNTKKVKNNNATAG